MDDFFSEIHPDKFGRSIDNSVVKHGRHNSDGTYPENSYIKCKKCGFIMNTARHPKGWGDGINNTTTGVSWYAYQEQSYGVGRYDPQSYYGDPTVFSGCPFCGVYNYER